MATKKKKSKKKPPQQIEAIGTELQGALKEKRLQHEITNLRRQLKEATNRALAAEELKEIIHGVAEVPVEKTPKWLKPRYSLRTSGVASMILSDWHYGEVVDPAQINYMNWFDRKLADKRIHHATNTAITLLKNAPRPQYSGCQLIALGDLVSGNIHEELRETNETTLSESVFYACQQFCQVIEAYRREFGKVHIVGVVGNHGRNTRKPRNKGRVRDNFDWLIYRFAMEQFRDCQDISWQIPDSPDAYWTAAGVRFLAMHGDKFVSRNAISEFFSALLLGELRTARRQISMQEPFDMMLVGHWHQHVDATGFIMGGSIKGYDEYAFNKSLRYARPTQATFVVHPEHGIVHCNRILCDSYTGDYDELCKQRTKERRRNA